MTERESAAGASPTFRTLAREATHGLGWFIAVAILREGGLSIRTFSYFSPP